MQRVATGMLGLGAAVLAASAVVRASDMPPPAIATLAGVNDAAILDGMPRKLSEYGFFWEMAGQEPAAKVRPYRLNVPLYSDGADKLRFVYTPGYEKLETGEDGLILWPVGSALIKTFAFGEGDGRRLIETRVLLHREDGWLALPYRWNEEQTEATLALAGARIEVDTPDHGEISYRVPNKNQCKECHGLDGEVIPIGPKVSNLSYGKVSEYGLPQPAEEDRFPLWEDREVASAEAAARAYLDVNCAHCHRPGATASNSGLDLRWQQSDPAAVGVRKRPVAAGRGSGGYEFSILPGVPDKSIMTHRMASTEPGIAMPELGKSTVDAEGLAAVTKWIEGMGE